MVGRKTMAIELGLQRVGENIFHPELFRQRLDEVIDTLAWWISQWPITIKGTAPPQEKIDRLMSLKDQFMDTSPRELIRVERDLIEKTFGLFALGYGIVLDEKLRPLLQKQVGELIGCMGALGVAKTTLMEAVALTIRADAVERESHLANPFWSFEESSLAKEVWFFLSSIVSDTRALTRPGLSVSDTCALADLRVWAPTHYEIGLFPQEEYKTYQRLANLLGPVIPRPHLIVALMPDTIEHLKIGVAKRAKDEEARRIAGEEKFAEPDDPNLAIQTKIVAQQIEQIPQQYGVPVFPMVVDPVAIYENPAVKQECVTHVLQRWNSLM
jgi:deoxyadenosine/deoxycytidine kinase